MKVEKKPGESRKSDDKPEAVETTEIKAKAKLETSVETVETEETLEGKKKRKGKIEMTEEVEETDLSLKIKKPVKLKRETTESCVFRIDFL